MCTNLLVPHLFYLKAITETMKKNLILGLLLSAVFSINAQDKNQKTMERALFASGCYWGTEYYMQKAEGVISTTVGYTGGHVENPTYREVCTGKTGHAETVEIIYDPSKTDFETLARLFFETHDPTQVDGQGPDIGTQYRSGIFYLNDEQKAIADKLVKELEAKGYKVATEITKAGEFYAEQQEYHQDYYDKNGKRPYCHAYTKRF